MVEYQFPVHDGLSCAHQCRPLCVADRGRALRRSVPLCARSESDGQHLRESVRAPLRNRLPARRNRPADRHSGAQAFPHRAPRSGIAAPGCSHYQASRQAPLQSRRDWRRAGRLVGCARPGGDGLLSHHLRSLAGGRRNVVSRHTGVPSAAQRGRSASARDPRDRRHHLTPERCCRARFHGRRTATSGL